MTEQRYVIVFCVLAFVLCIGGAAFSQTADVDGYVFDPNWFAYEVPYPQNYYGFSTAPSPPAAYGSPWYEYGVGGNRYGDETNKGVATNTENASNNYHAGDFGYFRAPAMGTGAWTLATWSRWWRPAFLIQANYPWTLPGMPILRLHANMFSYGASWPGNAYTPGTGPWNELVQSFVATGSAVTMITIRMPLNGKNVTATIHSGSPSGPQIGPTRTFTTKSGPTDMRLFYSGSDVPTIPGNTYYLKLSAPGDTNKVIFGESEPIPDLSDPMPNGCVYHDGVAQPGHDLGLIISSDDDGIVTDLNIDKGGTYGTPVPQAVTRLGQTFVARGTSLLYFGAYLTDHHISYDATLYNGISGGVPGAKIGYSKRNSEVRNADPEVIFTWEPGECPLTPGNTYYLEITTTTNDLKSLFAGSAFDEYPLGGCYVERVAVPNWDISGCIMEEESDYSSIWPAVAFSTYPAVAPEDRGARSLTVRWTTDVASDSIVEYGAWDATYTGTYYNSALVTSHVATITGLEPNTMYHFRVKSVGSSYKTGTTRDLVTCTINETPNLLANPGFEEVPPSPPDHLHHRVIPASWTFSGIGAEAGDGNYFAGIPPYAGSWLAEPAINGSAVHGCAYQTVSATPGVAYNFSAAIWSHILETDNRNWIPGTSPHVQQVYNKYKGWNQDREIDYLRIGIDPTGGTDRTSTNIVWTPAFYSNDRWTVAGVSATASANHITVFVKMDADSSAFHVYGIDDCQLSANYPAAAPIADIKGTTPDGLVTASDLIVTATTGQVGAYYAETDKRTQGIRIVSADTVALGSKVTVQGTLTTDPSTHERYIANAVFTSSVSDTVPGALLMQCQNLGGAAFGTLIPAVAGSKGPHNTGLLITIAGKVTQKAGDSSHIYVNDGSLPGDGVKIDTSRLAMGDVPAVDDVVSVTGISGLWLDGSDVKPLVYVRTADDISDPYN